MAQGVDMEHFARALYTAHEYNTAVVHPADRAEAEGLLIRLKDAPDGYALACNILAAEPFDQLRAFWAFNTLIHHINAVGNPNVASAIATPEEADNLYSVLAGWIRRVAVERALPDFILNKHAHTLVIGAYAFYPNNWCSFFDDLFEFNEVREKGGGDQVATYFLRIFEYIDEVVVDRHSQRSPQQRERDMTIKDIMREVAVRRAVDVWYNVLTSYHSRGPGDGLEVAQLCLSVLQSYVEWIDVSLLLTPYWVNLLYFLMSIHPLRVGACECIGQLVAKKQAPQVKVETLSALNIVDALNMLAPLVTTQMPTTEEEEQFTLSVAWLMVGAAEHLMACVEQNTPGAAGILRLVVPHVLSLLNLPLLSARDAVLPFVQSYCKWAPVEELQAVTETVFLQTCRAAAAGPLAANDDEENCDDRGGGGARHQRGGASSSTGLGNTGNAPEGSVGAQLVDNASVSSNIEDRNLEQRKQMHNALRLVYRRDATLIVNHCMYAVQTVTSGDPSAVLEGDAEGAVRFLYELGESVRLDTLFRAQQPPSSGQEFTTMITALLESRLIREHHGPLLHLAIVELCDRYYLFFVHQRDYIGTLLELLLQSPDGIVNANARVRSRICYLFGHLVQNLKAHMVPYAEPIFNALSAVLTPADGSNALVPADKADLYEALGTLLAASNELGRCQQVLQGVVDYTSQAVASISSGSSGGGARPATPTAANEGAAQAIADCISYMTSLAKGVGGIEATRMPDSPPQGPTAGPAGLFPGPGGGGPPGEAALQEAEQAMNAAVDAARQDPSANVFLNVLEHVCQLALPCLAFSAVRDKTLNFLQQLLNILGVAALPALEGLLAPMLRTTTIAEFPRIMRVMYQSVNKTKGAAGLVMGRSLLPLTMERIAAFGDVSELRALHNVISESARELTDVYRQYFSFVQSLVNGPAIAALMHESMQPSLGTLMDGLLGAVRTPPECDLGKSALVALTRLTTAWGDAGTSFEGFLFDSVLPTTIDEFTNGSVDLRDAKVLVLIGELCGLLRATAAKLEDAGLFRLYSLLTSASWVSHAEANDFCAAVRDNVNARTTMRLRQATKQLLELIASRRAQNGPGA